MYMFLLYANVDLMAKLEENFDAPRGTYRSMYAALELYAFEYTNIVLCGLNKLVMLAMRGGVGGSRNSKFYGKNISVVINA